MRFLVFCAMVVLMATASPCEIAQGEEISVVVPNDFADSEGQDYHGGMSNFRFQQIYSASQFSALSEGNHLLTGLSWRPDASSGPFSWSTDRLTVHASVTDVSTDDMSMTFASNITGPQFTIFDDFYESSTQCVGPPGGPKAFDMHVVFDPPFEYDPSEGNLLLDFQFIGAFHTEGNLRIDSTTETQHARVIGGSRFSSTAGGMLGGHIAQFTVVPEPSTIALLFTALLPIAFYWRRRKRTRTLRLS